MVKDRTRELNNGRSRPPASRPNDIRESASRQSPRLNNGTRHSRRRPDIPMQPLSTSRSTGTLDSVSQIDVDISKFREAIRRLSRLYESSLSNVRSDARGERIHGQIEELTNTTNLQVQSITNMIKALSTSTQMDKVQRDKVAKSFKDAIVEYQSVQSRYKKKYQERLERQYRIVNPRATEEEVKRVVDGEGGAIFAKQMMKSSLRGEAKLALEEAQDQHHDILQLEQSILELHQLFLELSTLIEQQGQVIETVETFVEQAEVQLEIGVEELDKGVELSKGSRKKRYILCFLCVLVLIVVSILVYLFAVKPIQDASKAANSQK